MSKSKLKAYLKGLKKEQLEEQLLDLYLRFKEVKTFYDFAFNPSEQKLMDTAKFKIRKEYFPESNRKAKKRRSVAQKLIKHYIQLEADPYMIIEIMLFNLEIAQQYCKQHPIKQDSFYKSMLSSFSDAVDFTIMHNATDTYKERLNRIFEESERQDWFNSEGFRQIIQAL